MVERILPPSPPRPPPLPTYHSHPSSSSSSSFSLFFTPLSLDLGIEASRVVACLFVVRLSVVSVLLPLVLCVAVAACASKMPSLAANSKHHHHQPTNQLGFNSFSLCVRTDIVSALRTLLALRSTVVRHRARRRRRRLLSVIFLSTSFDIGLPTLASSTGPHSLDRPRWYQTKSPDRRNRIVRYNYDINIYRI